MGGCAKIVAASRLPSAVVRSKNGLRPKQKCSRHKSGDSFSRRHRTTAQDTALLPKKTLMLTDSDVKKRSG